MADRFIDAGFKIEISKRKTRVTTYENLVLRYKHDDWEQRKDKKEKDEKSSYEDLNYYKRLKKRKKTIDEMCYNNFEIPNTVMITLTFDGKKNKKDYTQLDVTHCEFKKFIQRINSRYDNFKYIATFCRQENQNWHYHMICNFNRKILNDEIAGIWKNGYTYISYISHQYYFDNVVKYLTKNMESSHDELKGRRGYLCSKNVERNIVFTSWNDENDVKYIETMEKVKKAERRIIYEAKNPIGWEKKIQRNGQECTHIRIGVEENKHLQKQGYVLSNSVFTHLISKADFKEYFTPPSPAIKKQKKLEKKSSDTKE